MSNDLTLDKTEAEARFGEMATAQARPMDLLTVDDFEVQIGCILVEELPPERRIGMIQIPEAYAQKQNYGLVVGRHPHPDHPCSYERGDLVCFYPSSGNQIPIDGKVYRSLDYKDTDQVYGRFRGPAVKEALDSLHAQQVESD